LLAKKPLVDLASQSVTPTLVIRADATTAIGTGHVMRCLAIAQEWKRRGGRVVFVTHCEIDSILRRIEHAVGPPVRLESHHPSPSDLESTLAVLGPDVAALVLDGYHFDAEYEAAVRLAGTFVMTVDDEGERPTFEADMVLNQNIEAPDLQYNVPEGGIRLLGTRYALLRSEFSEFVRRERFYPFQARNVLVTIGGADPDNHTLAVLRVLDIVHGAVKERIDVTVVVGGANPNRVELEAEIARARYAATLAVDVSDMPRRMAEADVVISAAGTSIWELCYMGVPSLVMAVADNQIGLARGAAAAGAVVSLGDARRLDVASVASVVGELIGDKARRVSLSEHAVTLVDGKGSQRVVDALLSASEARG
jgi:UDP-2,4-diacetamido-2,4,6-trideoxy-beta-L-altropyranose hydrolase